MRALLPVLLLVLACSDPAPPPPPVVTLPPNTALPPSSAASTSTSTSTTANAPILSDLMKKVRDSTPPLIRGGDEARQADAELEALFRKIQASAPTTPPEDWQDEWKEITDAAINGKPDKDGVRPWKDACKICHDTFRETYKAKYRSRIIPVPL